MCYIALTKQLENLVEVDVDWDDEANAPAGTARLKREVSAWCDANLKSHELDWESSVVDRDIGGMEFKFFLSFEDDADMILFKMRWS